MLGCFERSLFPKVSRSARALAPELAVPGRQGCCGALHAHNGEPERGRQLAERLGAALPGQIVTTSGGCAAHLSAVLGRDRVTELSEYLQGRVHRPGPDRGTGWPGSPCRIPAICATAWASGASRGPCSARSPSTWNCPAPGGAAEQPAPTALVRPRDSRRVLDPKLDADRSGRDRLRGGRQSRLPAPAPARACAAGSRRCGRCISPICCAWPPADVLRGSDDGQPMGPELVFHPPHQLRRGGRHVS